MNQESHGLQPWECQYKSGLILTSPLEDSAGDSNKDVSGRVKTTSCHVFILLADHSLILK